MAVCTTAVYEAVRREHSFNQTNRMYPLAVLWCRSTTKTTLLLLLHCQLHFLTCLMRHLFNLSRVFSFFGVDFILYLVLKFYRECGNPGRAPGRQSGTFPTEWLSFWLPFFLFLFPFSYIYISFNWFISLSGANYTLDAYIKNFFNGFTAFCRLVLKIQSAHPRDCQTIKLLTDEQRRVHFSVLSPSEQKFVFSFIQLRHAHTVPAECTRMWYGTLETKTAQQPVIT